MWRRSIRLVGEADLREALDGDAALQLVDAPRQHQHQRQRQLGAGDIGAAADGKHRDAARCAGGSVDAAQVDAVFLHRLEAGRRGELAGADREAFDDQRGAVGEVGAQLVLCFDEAHLGRVEPGAVRANARAPAVEIGIVVGEKIGIGRVALAARIGIEHQRHDAQETVVFDDNEIGHSILR